MPTATKKAMAFREDDVKVLKGLEAVRKKPSMYIGPTDSYGIFTIIREPADNVIDEFEAGRADEMTIVLNASGKVEIHDNGAGMPVGMHKTERLPTLQVLVSMLHAGGKLETGSSAYKNSRGTHGIGIKATNALSKTFSVYTFRDKSWHTIGYAQGRLVTEFAEISKAAVEKAVRLRYKNGTVVVFEPDYTIFDKGSRIEADMIHEWAETSAYLAAGFSITVVDERGKNAKTERYCFENGIHDWLESEIAERRCGQLNKRPVEIKNEHLELVLTFTDADGCLLDGYCNGLYQSEGGNHLNTVLSSLYASLKPYSGARDTFSRDDVAEGVLGIVNFKIDSPRFGGQTKTKLTDPRFDELCKSAIDAGFVEFWARNKTLAREVVKRASDLRGAKEQFAINKRAMQELKGRQRDMGRLPGKLAMVRDCRPEDRELFLVEGDSAEGTARSARMTQPFRYQETLGLKGKPANAYKAKNERLLVSEEVMNILMAIGFDPDSKDPLGKLRVGKIIMLSDPDPDGYHINSLILALLARMLPGLFERGMVYAVVSPKYLLTHAGQQYFAMTLEELKARLPKGANIEQASYLKGWGEATPTAMRDIAFNPATRQLIQITIGKSKTEKGKPISSREEFAEFARLMGDDPEYKRAMLGIAG